MRVIGYVRVSTEEQAINGQSLDAQRAKLEGYAALYDLDQSRLARLYDELAVVLRQLPQDRREAFEEYVRDEQEATESSRDAQNSD